jgi:hypothetical protein
MIALLLLLLLLTSCVWSVTIEEDEPLTKADTTLFQQDTTKKDTIDIDIQIDTTMIPISFEVTVEEWENKET